MLPHFLKKFWGSQEEISFAAVASNDWQGCDKIKWRSTCGVTLVVAAPVIRPNALSVLTWMLTARTRVTTAKVCLTFQIYDALDAITETMKVHTDAMKTDAKSTYVRMTGVMTSFTDEVNALPRGIDADPGKWKMTKMVPCRRSTQPPTLLVDQVMFISPLSAGSTHQVGEGILWPE